MRALESACIISSMVMAVMSARAAPNVPQSPASAAPMVLRRGAVLAQVFVLLAALVFLVAGWDAMPTPYSVWWASVFYSAQSAWLLASARIVQRQWMSGYLAFSLLLLMFSGGRLYLSALGAVDGPLLEGRVGEDALLRAALLVNASVAAFHLGGLIGLARSFPRLHSQSGRAQEGLRGLGLGLVVLGGAGFASSAVEMVLQVSAGGYFALFSSGTRTGASNWDAVLATALAPGLLISFASDPASRWKVRAIWTLAVGFIVLMLFLGDRSGAMCVLLPMVLIHHRLVSPFGRRTAAVAVLVAIITLPLVAAIRDLGAAGRSAGLRDTHIGLAHSLKSLTTESGFSMTTIAGTIERVPVVRGFDYGAGYIRAALAAVPNLFWEEHPASSSKTYAYWLVWQMDPSVAGLGGGYGYSLIAEAFANFGAPGAVVIPLLLGWLLGRLTFWSALKPRSVLLFEALVLWAVAMLPRGETISATRSLAWFVLLPFIFTRLRERRAARSAAGYFGQRCEPQGAAPKSAGRWFR